MKAQKLIIGLILSFVLSTSCSHDSIRASGEVTSLDYSIPDYKKLKVSNAFNIYVTFSDNEESIRIEANDNIHDKIVVKREGNTLVVRLKKFTNVRGNATLNAYIVTRNIKDFDISGASGLTLENEWNVESGEIKLTGASDFTGEVAADRLNLTMSGASNINIFGSITALEANLSGSSDIRDYDLSVERLNVKLSGASKALLSVNESIDIEASGASILNYRGDALVNNKRLSGASEINKR